MKTLVDLGYSLFCRRTEQYSYGFNGKENDNETVGTGSGTQDYGMRIYNPALGRFLSRDPISFKYPYLSPYQFASNSPIVGIDEDGLELSIPMFGLHLTSTIERISFKGLIQNVKVGFSSAMTGNNYGFTNQLKLQINYSEADKISTQIELKLDRDLYGYGESETESNPGTSSSYVLTVKGLKIKEASFNHKFEFNKGINHGDAGIKTASELKDQIEEGTNRIVIEEGESKDLETSIEDIKNYQNTMKEQFKSYHAKTFFSKPKTSILKPTTMLEAIKGQEGNHKSMLPKLNFKPSTKLNFKPSSKPAP